MVATIYVDFTLFKWLRDIEKWYDEIYYPKNYKNVKTVKNRHLRIIRNHYNYDQIPGDNIYEKRIAFFNFAQS